MEILYLSSLCSVKKYEQMFKQYGSTSSHASQKFNRLVVEGLIENGCSVECLSERIILDKSQNFLPFSYEVENKVHYAYLPYYQNKYKNRILTIWNAYSFISKWSQVHPKGIVVCDIILGELSIALNLVKKVRKVKTTAIVTDVPNIRANDSRRGLRALPAKLKNALVHSYDSFIFLTEQMNRYLNPKQKPYVVVEGLVDKHVIDCPNRLENKYPYKVIMMAGSLENVYGVDVLLEAFHQQDDSDVRLKFYGKGSAVDEIISFSKTDDRIEYCGELTNSQIVEEEKKCTLLINPRPPIGVWTAYSFPSKNMEYMASGTPLVAFNLPCIPNEYRSYFYQLEEYSIESIRDILEKILRNSKSDLHDFGIRSQNWIVKTKSPKSQLSKYVNMAKNF